MCSVTDNNFKIKQTPLVFAMDGGNESCHQKEASSNCSILLEFSASDDLISFKRAVEEDGAAINEANFWYGRRIGSRKMGLEQRTPLMIAAMFGSVDVLKYILTRGGVDVNQACGSDRATALHCAAAGGSASGSEIVKLLLDASADVEAIDVNGNRPGDVIAPASPVIKPRMLEMLLKGGEEGCVSSSPTASMNSEDLQQMERLSEKKEYPIDLSMPDIKNGIYGTDEFRMYTFKVKPCSRAYSHDWTECPFVHPGENARRRDPRKYHYSCVPCPEFRKGTCRQGDACEYAHGVFECWLHPAQYRTRLCKDETGCTRRVCFFAHKKEELRPLYPSTGSAVPSPRSTSAGLSSLDMASMSPLSLGGSPTVLMIPTSTPPMSPSSSPSTIGGASWQSQLPPALQLPGSRLKTALSARDMDLDMDLVGVDGHQQQQLMDEMSNLSGRPNAFSTAAALAAISGSRSGKFNHINTVTPSNLDDVFGSVDPSSLSQLKAAAAASAAQYQSAVASLYQSRQNLNQQLHSSYGSSMSSSPGRTSSSFGLDPSSAVAAAVMNSRAAAFAKRSQSFSERAVMNRHPGLTAMATTSMATPSMLSDWGSPNGKLDWGIQGEELNKLRKSASFGIRTSSTAVGAATTFDEPDISWVQSLVKDGPSGGWMSEEMQGPMEMLSPWAEQMYMEQEQMVA
ncbi:zinc finger CCCH domain-containing protein 66-like [Magnolia sinica]|uniref:zinc finger CCCH domain-containing protein 66-like n=1 Tax=Magnolia sinica TaxID=86752 RepID=UPI0026589C41|nr:zinc finger CCCH domain-containing protein 66-like [Magnolia sinica]